MVVIPGLMKQIKIILVDDDEDDYILFKNVLDQHTYNTVLQRVTDCDGLMEILDDEKQELPEIIFLDMNLPRKSGLEILRILKLQERLRDIIIAIYSTTCIEKVANHLYELGANFYITKPVKFADMQRVIEAALGIISDEKVKYVRSKESYLIL